MSPIKNSVLLLKSDINAATDDKYAVLLKRHNFQVMLLKTLTFKYKNLEALQVELEKHEDYSGLIFTSPRCVTAVFQCLANADILSLWQDKINFAVGDATNAEAVQKLGLNCLGAEAGNAKTLAGLILKDKEKYSKPFLYPHGNLKSDTLERELASENIKCSGVLVYETLVNPDLENELKAATGNFTRTPEFVVFFSPSGFHNAITHLTGSAIDLNALKFVAIGPTTELAITEGNFPVYATATTPTPGDLLKALAPVQ